MTFYSHPEMLSPISYEKKGLHSQDQVEKCEMEKLFWIIHMGPKCDHRYPYKRETKGNLKCTEEKAI